MHLYSYLGSFIASVVLSLTTTRFVRSIAIARGLVAPPVLDRHIHQGAIPRLGGVAVFLSFMLVSVIVLFSLRGRFGIDASNTIAVTGLLGAGTIVMFLGIYDDLRGAGARLKFGVQTCAAMMLYWTGHGVRHFDLIFTSGILRTAVGLPLTVFWVLLITNAFNLIDGLDGLAAGSAVFSTIVIFAVSLLRHNVVASLITATLAGAILGFLPFNFNPASIFLGDSGSLFIGFMLSAVALAGSEKATTSVAVAIPVVAFGLPIVDVILAVFRRFVCAKPLFDGDSDHIHHRLLKRGLSHRKAVLILYGVTACFGLLSMTLLHGEKILALALVLIATGVVFGIQELRYVEFAELNAFLHRALFPKRIVANNIRIRRAVELLNSCKDRETLCKILQDTLQPLGFSGFRLECFDVHGASESSIEPLRYDSKGGIEFCWSAEGALEPDWELRLQLSGGSGRRLGYLCLLQMYGGHSQFFDLRVITDGVRTSISEALQRTMPQCQVGRVDSRPSSDGEARLTEEQDSKRSLALSRAASTN